MKNNLATYLNKIMRERKLHRRTLSVLALVAVFVGVTVLWQLHITGIAVTGEALCGMPEHVHTDACLQTEMVCGLQETDGHTHTDDCYTIESILACEEEHDHTNDCFMEVRTLVCGQEECEPHHHTDDCYLTYYLCGYEQEHVHTEACYADEGAEDNWQASIPAELSGNWAADTLAIARSQIGYEESKINYTEDEDGTRHGYTRYGAFYGTPYAPWDAAFVNFCLTNAGVDAAVLPQDTVLENWKQTLSQAGLLAAADNVPQAGDIVFVDDRAGIVSAVGEGTINVIQRDDSGFVSELGYITSDESISGYVSVGTLQPAQAETTETAEPTENAEQAAETTEPTEKAEEETTESTESEETKPETVKSNSKTVKGDDFTITAYYDDEAGIPANAVLKATKYDKDSEEYKAHEEQAGTKFDYLFDIGFYIGIGESEKEIEPLTPVTVTIEFPGDDKQYSVTHFADDGIEMPEVDSKYNEQTAEAAVTYETESFSPFGFSKLTQKVGVYSNDNSDSSNEIVPYAAGDTVTGTITSGFEDGKQYIIYREKKDKNYALTTGLGKETITVKGDQATASTSTLWTYQSDGGKLYFTDANGHKQYLCLNDKKLGVTPEEGSAATISYEDNMLKIGDRYLEYDDDKFKTDDDDDDDTIKIAVVGGGTGPVDPGPVDPDPDPVNPGDDQNELAKHKYVKYNAEEDTYDLTLDIAGKIGSETNKAKVDVVFVLDVSGSMNDKIDSGKSSPKCRDAANDAIKAMVGSLSAKAATVDARYSLVTFSGSNDWPDSPYDDAQTNLTWSDSANDLENALPNTSNGGTNYEAGLRNAAGLLGSARDGAKKVVVFVSDGEPSFYYNNWGLTAGSGSDYDETALTHAKNELNKMSMDYFYTVGVGPSKNYTRLQEDGLLSGITDTKITTGFFAGTDEKNLQDAFSQITGSILTFACSNVTVIDTLSDYAELVDATATPVVKVTDSNGNTVETPAGITATAEDKIIKLNFPKDYTLKDGYTYSVTVEIRATQKAKTEYTGTYQDTGDAGTDAEGNNTSSGKAGFYCNDSATVTYDYKDNKGVTENYPKPVIQVDEASIPRLEPVNFYINLSSKILDTDGDVAGRDKGDFTTCVSGPMSKDTSTNQGIGGEGINPGLMMQIPADHSHPTSGPIAIIGSATNGSAYDADNTIRTKLPQTADGYTVTDKEGWNGTYKIVGGAFPKDEDIFKYIRDNWGDPNATDKTKRTANMYKPIKVGDQSIDPAYLTTDYFTIRWYVCKDEPTDCWHIDGILVPKTATLTVTKRFEDETVGEAAKTDQINGRGDYTISVSGKFGNADLNYPLKLVQTGDDTTSNVATYDEDTKTYTWTLQVPVDQDQPTYQVEETGYDVDGYIFQSVKTTVTPIHKNGTYTQGAIITGDEPSTTIDVVAMETDHPEVENLKQQVDFINNYEAGETLPNTGGIGTTLFRILGGCLLVVAAVSWCIKRRQLHG